MHRTLLYRILPAALAFLILTPLFIDAFTPEVRAAMRRTGVRRTARLGAGANTLAAKGKETLVRERLAELFELCRARDYVQAASYLVYHGEQKRRNWKDSFNFNNRDEQPPVESMCNRIRDLLHGSDGQEYGELKVEKESEGEWVVLEVTFRKSGKRMKGVFAFLKVKGKYCLGDID